MANAARVTEIGNALGDAGRDLRFCIINAERFTQTKSDSELRTLLLRAAKAIDDANKHLREKGL